MSKKLDKKTLERLEMIKKLPVYYDPLDNDVFANALGHDKSVKLDYKTIERTAEKGLWYWDQPLTDEEYKEYPSVALGLADPRSTFYPIRGSWITRNQEGELVTCKCNGCRMDTNREYLTFAPREHCMYCECKICVCPARRVWHQYANCESPAYSDSACGGRCVKCFLERFGNEK